MTTGWNHDCSFIETVLTPPFGASEVAALGIPPGLLPWVRSPTAAATELVAALKELGPLCSWIAGCVAAGDVHFVRKEEEPPMEGHSQHELYVRFASLDGPSEGVSMRDVSPVNVVPPDWIEASAKSLLGRHLPYLSGMRLGPLVFPPILLDPEDLGSPDSEVGPPPALVDNHWLVREDYWGIASMVDARGRIVQWHPSQRERLRHTGQSYSDWIVAELADPFGPRPKPSWLAPTTPE